VEGAALYTVMCNDQAGIIDDLIVYRVEDGFLIVVNAARRQVDIDWMRAHLLPGSELSDESDATALLAVQGPAALAIVTPLAKPGLDSLETFHSFRGSVAGVPCRISRTGYTGEDGLELYCEAGAAPGLWDALVDAGRPSGMLLVGLAARDTLRLEAGLRLYGQDMDDSVDPFSCGLAWTVKLGKGEFIGASRLRELDPSHPPRRFAGLLLGEHDLPRHGMAVASDGREVGRITSGGFSFSLGQGIGTAYLETQLDPEAALTVDIRGRAAPARRVRLPFLRRPAPAG